MPRRAEVLYAQTPGITQFNGAGTNNIVQTPGGELYVVYINTVNDVAFKKSTNGGLTWSDPVLLSGAIGAISIAIWYDKWSGLSGGLIHVVFSDNEVSDTFYRTIDTASSDALSTLVTIFLGASGVATGSHLSVTRARGGNVYCKSVIDNGVEGGFFRLLNANVPNGAWASRTIDETLAGSDQIILVPGFAADNQDIMAIFWDASADEVSRKIHDDSADTWVEASIATAMVELAASTAFPHFACAVDLVNSQILLAAWSAIDIANADLRFWTITESAITEKTNVVLNSTDDQGLAGVVLDLQTGYWWVLYAGKSDGSETCWTSLNIYCKVSTDSGTTWGPETVLSTRAFPCAWLSVCPRLYLGPPVYAIHNNIALDELLFNTSIISPRASLNIGI